MGSLVYPWCCCCYSRAAVRRLHWAALYSQRDCVWQLTRFGGRKWRSGMNRIRHPDWVKLSVELNCAPNQNTKFLPPSLQPPHGDKKISVLKPVHKNVFCLTKITNPKRKSPNFPKEKKKTVSSILVLNEWPISRHVRLKLIHYKTSEKTYSGRICIKKRHTSTGEIKKKNP